MELDLTNVGNMRNFLRTWLKYFLHIFFPISCPVCGCLAETACPECLVALRGNWRVSCFECESEYPCKIHSDAAWIYSYARHEEKARELALLLKYTGQAAIGREMGRAIGKSLENISAALKLNMKDSILIPIPLHKNSERKFNQSLLIAKGLSDVLGLDVEDVVEWTAEIESQSGKNRSERISMPQDIFAVSEKLARKIHGKKIILVDDVLTTGTTIRRAASACIRGGARFSGVFVWTTPH